MPEDSYNMKVGLWNFGTPLIPLLYGKAWIKKDVNLEHLNCTFPSFDLYSTCKTRIQTTLVSLGLAHYWAEEVIISNTENKNR